MNGSASHRWRFSLLQEIGNNGHRQHRKQSRRRLADRGRRRGRRLVGADRRRGRVGGAVCGTRRGLLGLDRRRGRGGGRLGPEELVRQQHGVDGVDGEGEVEVEVVADRSLVDPRGHVDLAAAAAGCDVDRVDAFLAGGLRADGVAGGLEGGGAVEPRQHVVQNQRHLRVKTSIHSATSTSSIKAIQFPADRPTDLLLAAEAVEGAGLEVVEGVVGGREDGQAIEGVVQLALDLPPYLRRLQQPDERLVLPALLQDPRQVERPGRLRRRRDGRRLGGREQQREHCGKSKTRSDGHCTSTTDDCRN